MKETNKSKRAARSPMEFSLPVLFPLLLLILPMGTPAAGLSDSTGVLVRHRPGESPAFSIPSIANPPRIDGWLNESVWRSAVCLQRFFEVDPGDNIEPEVETETFLAYDRDNLYLAFVCRDNPDGIRASMTDRDQIFEDDIVGVIIDTFDDKQNAFEFLVNPYGIQADLRRSSNQEDVSFDTVWESASRIDSSGWTAEVAIPFRSLRFPNREEQRWRMLVVRSRPRTSRQQIVSVPISRDDPCLLCQADLVAGIRAVNQGRNLELLPYAIGSQSGTLRDSDDPGSGFVNDNPHAEGGLGIKYGLTPNLTFDLTLNPDFSQVESDVAQIDVNTTFAIFYPEKRPFFLEGSEIFRMDGRNRIIYTRSVNDPSVAAKMTGKAGRFSIGYLFARDEASPFVVPFEERTELALGAESYSNILRIKRDFLSDSYLGLVATDRRMVPSGSNTLLGLDASVRFRENYRVSARLLYTYTREPDDTTLSDDFADTTFADAAYTTRFDGESYRGHGVRLELEREARHFEFGISYDELSPTFRADNGFIRDNDFRLAFARARVIFYPDNRLLDIWGSGCHAGRKYNFQGTFKDTWISPEIFFRFKKQTTVRVEFILSRERFQGVLIDGIRRLQGELSTKASEVIGGGLGGTMGRSIAREEDPPILGRETSIFSWFSLKPTSRMRLVSTFNYSRMLDETGLEELFSGYTLRNKLTYQFTRCLFLRLITQYDSFNERLELDPLLGYKLNPFTVFFLGSTHDLDRYGRRYHETERQFFVKLQYLFRI